MTREMEANRCAISARDCDAAMEYLDAYLELKEKDDESGTGEFFTHREGLLIAAIVSYSRAFTESRSEPFAAPRLRVNLGKVFTNDSSKIELHKLILNKRNKAVAHSDWQYHKSELRGVTKEKGVLRRHSDVMYGEGIDIGMFRNIAETMRNHFRLEMYDRDVSGAKN
jgi:hypothetical protein